MSATQITVRGGVEVRAPGDLRIAADWNLPSQQIDRAIAPRAADTSLTLLAAGDVTISGHLSSGFERNAVLTADKPVSDRGGSIAVVAGADLGAADVGRTMAASAAGITLGRGGQAVSVRSTTGDVSLLAAGDVTFLNPQATVYTTGRSVASPGALDAAVQDFATDPSETSPFLTDAGAVTIRAGRDVRGAPVNPDRPSAADWWWHTSPDAGVRMWWSRFDLFDQGVASFGGGAVTVEAGRDLIEVRAASASNGLRGDDGSVLFEQRGGHVALTAGRDIVNGAVLAGGAQLDVRAGAAIRRDAGSTGTELGLQVVHERTAMRVQAGADITISSVRDVGVLQPSADNRTGNGELGNQAVVAGLGQPSSLEVTAAAGDIVYRGDEQRVSARLGNVTEGYRQLGQVLPGSVSFAAPGGGITLAGQSLMTPSADGSLLLLASGDVRVAGLNVLPAVGARPTDVVSLESERLRLERLISTKLDASGALDASGREPVRIVSTAGDVNVDGTLVSVRPVRLIAGEDLLLGASGRIVIQHQPSDTAGELSLLQAGRDIRALAGVGGGVSGIEIGGPGDLVLLAGRHIDLGASLGISSTGNRDNGTVLPRSAADVTLVAGLRADGDDYRRAARQGFALIGAADLAQRAGDLFALLSDGAGAPGNAAAASFDALSASQQLEQLRTLLGDDALKVAQLAFMRGQPGGQVLAEAAALQAFDALPEGTRRLGIGAILASQLDTLPAAQRQAFVAAIAAQRSGAEAKEQREAFVDYVARAGGVRPADLAAALAAFEALPLERQAVWLNRALVAEVRRHGRAASALGGVERSEAYARAYLGIDALFPWADDVEGDIALPTSQIRTVQQADITLLAQRGGINAGALGDSGARAADLGILTVSGGGISALVRDDFEVNQSRVFTLDRGDILIWASLGNIDAGRGAKTVTGAPAPTLRLDSEGRLTLDTSGSFSGSGIAVLDADSALDLYAPLGEINAGEAGIKSAGQAFFATLNFRGADDIKVSGGASGGPPAAPPPPSAAGLSAQASATSAGTRAESEEDEEEKRRKRRVRRNLLLDFLGFGSERN